MVIHLFCIFSASEKQLETVQQCFLTDQADIYRKITNPSLCKVDWHILSDDMLLLEFVYRQEFVPETITTNIVLASFIQLMHV